MPILLKVLAKRMLRLLPPSISTMERHVVPTIGLTMSE
jgi:hypothetical protein